MACAATAVRPSATVPANAAMHSLCCILWLLFDGRDWSNAGRIPGVPSPMGGTGRHDLGIGGALGADPECAKSAGTIKGTYRTSVATGASQEPERE